MQTRVSQKRKRKLRGTATLHKSMEPAIQQALLEAFAVTENFTAPLPWPLSGSGLPGVTGAGCVMVIHDAVLESGVGQIFGLMPEAKRALKASIKNANVLIEAASKELGLESPIKTRDEMFKVGIAILSRFAQEGVLPDWYTLLYQGYDPDFVFGLQAVLVKPDKKTAAPEKAGMEKAILRLLMNMTPLTAG